MLHILNFIQDTEPTPSDADSDVSDTESPASERSQTSDSELPDIPLLMGLTYKEIKAYGLIISANNKAKITVDEIQEHLIMPSYPATKDSGSLEDPGILHFIHCSNPIGPNIDSESINAIFTKEMSRVCSSLVSSTCLTYA